MLSTLVWKFFVVLETLRRWSYWKVIGKSFMAMGSGVRIDSRTEINNPQKISIGNDVYIGKYVIVAGYGGITIGNGVVIAAGCRITSRNHMVDAEKGYGESGYTYASVCIGDSVWLGYDVIVLPGVCIGSHSVIAAGSVVCKNVPSKQLWAGVPAKFVKSL